MEQMNEENKKLAFEMGQAGWIIPGGIARGDVFFVMANVLKEVEIHKENRQWQDMDTYFQSMYIELFTMKDCHWLKIFIEDIKNVLEEMNLSRIFEQAIEAYWHELYIPCVYTMIPLFEGTLSIVSGYSGTNMKRSFDNLLRKKDLPYYEKYNIEGFINSLTENKNFKEDSEPDRVNRHWLLHGRSTKDIKMADCIKLINALKFLTDFL